MRHSTANIALLAAAVFLAAGLASAQRGVTVSTVNSGGTVTTSSYTGASGGPTPLAPFSTDGNSKYWDGLGLGGASTNYFTQVPYINATPNPQIATGPDDILTIVNRTIARYPNPNSAGQTPTIGNPYSNPPTEFAPLDVWMGLTVLGGLSSGTALCPSGTGSNSTCVIDNASVRYDQLQGRFVVLFTVTDLPAHRSNWVLVVSRFAQLQQCATPPTIGGAVCQTPLFTSPVIAPIVGGTSTGGVNTFNWVLYAIPINLTYNTPQQPSALGLINNPLAPPPLSNPLANSAVGTLNNLTLPSSTTPVQFLTVPFCINGGPQLPLTFNAVAAQNGNPATPLGAGGTGRTCTNYYPTGARLGFDNDNIILTAPVLDMAFAPNEGNFPSAAGQNQGPYAGTRVTAIAKFVVYNGKALTADQPGPTPTNPANANCLAATPISCNAVNLSDDAATGTLTEITQKIAFAQGARGVLGASKSGDLAYGGNGGNFNPSTPNSCLTSQPVAVVATPNVAVPPAVNTPGQAVLSCAPLATLTRALPAIFWEPDNLRGRALASFDSQVAPFGTSVSGAITPYDYLVGTEITDNLGSVNVSPGGSPLLSSASCAAQPQPGCPGIISQGVSGITGQSGTVASVTVTGVSMGGPPFTITVSAADAAKLQVGDVTNNGQNAQIIMIAGTTITLTAQALPTGTTLPATLSFVVTAVPGGTIPLTAGIATVYYVQPIAFNCPATSLFGGTSSVVYCGQGVNGTQAQVGDLPILGALRRNVSTLAPVADPSPVGQGFSASQLTTNPSNIPVTSTVNSSLFVGDSRPTQVLFREGLLYISRNVRLADQQINWLGTSTVLYDILKTCAQVSVTPAAPSCGGYSVTGGGITAPNLAFEFEWYNGTNVPDPVANLGGFGFYQPMFEVPADVIANTPASPSQGALPLLDKLFVGMTTGGTNNTLGTFAADFPSLWDFRPGDDAYDTARPYLDPYTGSVNGTYNCSSDITVTVIGVTNGNTITVDNAASLAVGMFLSGTQTTILAISGNTVILSSAFTGSVPTTATFTVIQPIVTVTAASITAGSNQVRVVSTTGLQIGQVIGTGSNAGTGTASFYTSMTGLSTFGVNSLLNIGPGETVTGAQSGPVSATVSGTNTIDVPVSSQVGTGGVMVIGSGIPSGTFINAMALNATATAITLTLSQSPTVPGSTSVLFDTTNCFTPNTLVTSTADATTSGLTANGVMVPGVTVTNAVSCTDHSPTIQFDNGLPLTFTAGGFFPAGTTIVNITGSSNGGFITLSNPAVLSSANVPLNFLTAGTALVPQCPIIPFSQRGGASTDPNDGSLWLFGQFAKNRLSTIPGPGQWGTSVANYALSFPATDVYGNDNTYFQDVQPPGTVNSTPDSVFFTWIQIAKNLGIAVPSATGPCSINNGVTPIIAPPTSGSQPVGGGSTLGCPYFGPDTTVTRAEMAYWVVKAQMDEAQVSNYLCATGGDPTGLATTCNGAIPAFTFADVASGVTNPFLGAVPSLNIAGVTTSQLQRYIEVMVRRGYTKGCGTSTNDPLFGYCPNAFVTRAQMAVFLIRAKMNNVFPTTLSGLQLSSPYGDNFGVFTPTSPYFSDVSSSDPVYGPYALYIQKMRELRITNGTTGSTFSPGNNLTRKEIATFVVRAFFL